MSHLETAQAIYQAFGTGDIPGLMSHISDDVEWEPGLVDRGVPWLIPGKGKDHVMKFFGAVGGGMEMKSFEVLNMLAGGDQVAVIIRLSATIRATGKPLDDTECHVWTFGPDGKAISMRHFVDTAGHVAAAGVA